MSRQFQGQELVVATHNKGKLEEITFLLKNYVPFVFSSDDLNLDDVEETGKTFEENAILKAISSAKQSGKVCLADDSGFCVEAMNGAPGVYSARFAIQDGKRDFNYAIERIWSEIKDNPNKRASFVCVLALAWPDGHVETVRGEIKGDIIWPPKGKNGFGYDPIFQLDGYNVSFAEMPFEEKQKTSHRFHAFELMIQKCFQSKQKTA